MPIFVTPFAMLGDVLSHSSELHGCDKCDGSSLNIKTYRSATRDDILCLLLCYILRLRHICVYMPYVGAAAEEDYLCFVDSVLFSFPTFFFA